MEAAKPARLGPQLSEAPALAQLALLALAKLHHLLVVALVRRRRLDRHKLLVALAVLPRIHCSEHLNPPTPYLVELPGHPKHLSLACSAEILLLRVDLGAVQQADSGPAAASLAAIINSRTNLCLEVLEPLEALALALVLSVSRLLAHPTHSGAPLLLLPHLVANNKLERDSVLLAKTKRRTSLRHRTRAYLVVVAGLAPAPSSSRALEVASLEAAAPLAHPFSGRTINNSSNNLPVDLCLVALINKQGRLRSLVVVVRNSKGRRVYLVEPQALGLGPVHLEVSVTRKTSNLEPLAYSAALRINNSRNLAFLVAALVLEVRYSEASHPLRIRVLHSLEIPPNSSRLADSEPAACLVVRSKLSLSSSNNPSSPLLAASRPPFLMQIHTATSRFSLVYPPLLAPAPDH